MLWKKLHTCGKTKMKIVTAIVEWLSIDNKKEHILVYTNWLSNNDSVKTLGGSNSNVSINIYWFNFIFTCLN